MKALNCTSCIPYSATDVGTGRCRMSRAGMQRNRIVQLGTCAKLRLHVGGGIVYVLCTIWPDNIDCLGDEECCVDSSVCIGLADFQWMECACEVIDTWIPSILTTLHVKNDLVGVKNSDLLGIALTAGCTVHIHRHNASTKEATVGISRISAQTVGIVTSSTVIIREARKPSEDSDPVGSEEPDGTVVEKSTSFCNISVVNEIMHRVVIPYVNHSSEPAGLIGQYCAVPPLIKGLLLVGPPGVGKTYAVRAVQRLCSDNCKVRIFEVNVPTLLSSADPLVELNKLFAEITSLRRSPVSDKDSSTVSGSSPSTPGTPVSSKYASSSTPASSRGASSTPATKQNTFTYRSPAAMAAAAAAQTPSSSSTASATPPSLPPTTPMSKSAVSRTATGPGSAFSFAKKGPGFGGAATPPPSTLKEMLAASRGSSLKTAKSPAPTPLSHAVAQDDSVEQLETVNCYPELAFVVVDEIDALGKGGMQNENQIVIKQFLCRWLDEQNAPSRAGDEAARLAYCMVGTSNRSGDIDVAFRRGGRLEHEIAVQNTQEDRCHLLQRLLADTFSSEDDADTEHSLRPGRLSLSSQEVAVVANMIAMQTGGYVAADLSALVAAIAKIVTEASPCDAATTNCTQIVMQCFHTAAKSVTPSCLRGATISLPNLTFDDVIGNEEVKRSLQRVMSFAKPEKQDIAARFGLTTSPGGVLLHGPPGNSKTRLASAAAAHFGLPMISLSAADIYSPYVGDAEAEVRRAFQLARQAAPCVLFIDELDSIVTNRSNDSGGGSSSASVEGRVLATLLTEMDGIQNTNSSEYSTPSVGGSGSGGSGGKSGAGKQNSSGGVIVLGATNRLDFIDAALIRKGRFHHVLHVAPPNTSERELLLLYFCAKCGLSSTTSGLQATEELRPRLKEGMSGAEIENICKEAALTLHSQQLFQ